MSGLSDTERWRLADALHAGIDGDRLIGASWAIGQRGQDVPIEHARPAELVWWAVEQVAPVVAAIAEARAEAAPGDDGGLPRHLPMGVTADGDGPTESDPPHHRVCWCGDPACAWTVALAAERADAARQALAPVLALADEWERLESEHGSVLTLSWPGIQLRRAATGGGEGQ